MLPLVVRVHDSKSQSTMEHVFRASPIRIGRNPLNNLCLGYEFVSQWHAAVFFNDRRIRFKDLNSTNGTHVNAVRPENRLPGGDPVELSSDSKIIIGTLYLEFERTSLDDEEEDDATRTVYTAMGGGKRSGKSAHTTDSHLDVETLHEGLGDLMGAVKRLQPLYDDHRKSWSRLRKGLETILGSLTTEARSILLGVVEDRMPEVTRHPEYRELVRAFGLQPTPTPEATSFEAIQRFAQVYLSSRAIPQSAEELEGFLAQIAAALETFSEAFMGSRRGYEQFVAETGIRVAPEKGQLYAIDDQRDVLEYVLDWTLGRSERLQELKTVFADISIHQVAILEGIRAGVKELLGELSPAVIDREVDGFSPFRAASRWRKFSERHGDLSEDQRLLFSVVFGREFFRAYNQVAGRALDETRGGSEEVQALGVQPGTQAPLITVPEDDNPHPRARDPHALKPHKTGDLGSPFPPPKKRG